ncbi:4'-phosphopantetheinyl transferase superfamily protein [Kineococcus sp. TBRC 1896]|uniref:4'-phosphopantetheinyl transferase superfamily protein n=1 Tax=Kineococcus mangrovi TaxID=1660183 RepID=A0ABV4I071_9ACTN
MGVHVLVRPPVPDVPDWLPVGEVHRADRSHRDVDRSRRLTAAVLLHEVAGRLCGLHPGDVRLVRVCPACGPGDHGRPTVLGDRTVHLSSTHSGQVVAALGAVGARVGVDAEPLGRTEFPGFDDIALHPAERRRLAGVDVQERSWWRTRQWTRKEALFKALGTGLTLDPRGVDVRDDGTLAWVGRAPVTGAPRPRRWQEVTLDSGDHVITCVALPRGSGPSTPCSGHRR